VQYTLEAMAGTRFWWMMLSVLSCDGWDVAGPPATHSTTTTSVSSTGSAGAAAGAGGSEGGAGGSGGHAGAGGPGGAGPVPDCADPVGPVPALALELIAANLTQPLGLEVAPGDPDRLFVLEKQGRIRVIENGTLLPDPFLDLTSTAWSEGEAGLLALAFHPNYPKNGRLFVYYTQLIGNNGARIYEFRRSTSSPNLADPTPVGEPLISVLHAHIHDGGSLEFSPIDGLLYVSLGERGTSAWAQDLGLLLGKILRIDISTTPYSIPPGNMPGGLPEIWDYGLRNPWRMNFDPCTGDLYVGDVGASAREEIDIESPGGGGHNYGWPIMEGFACVPESSVCDTTGLTLPTIDHTHGAPDNFQVMVGGVVYRGSAIPGLRGMYLYGDASSGLRGLRYHNGMVTELVDFRQELQGQLGSPVSFGQDLAGEVYVVDYLPEGRVLRLTSR
jgi:glucose/arabinose dehydrogenase